MKLFKKFLYTVVLLALLIAPLSVIKTTKAFAIDAPTTIEDYSDFDWDSYYEELYEEYDDYNDDYSYSTLDSEDVEEAALAAFVGGTAILAVILTIAGAFGIVMYIYMGITMMKVAQKLNHENPWFAWIPILNIVQIFQLGEQNPWLVALILIPGLGGLIVGVISIIALMKICEKRGYDKLLALLVLIPIGNLILLGMLAWGKKEGTAVTE